MPQFKHEAVCLRCGGPGVSQVPYWFGFHMDPRTCNFYLELRNAELERKLREKKEQANAQTA